MQYIFDVDEATKYGLEEAVFIYNLKFWIERNRANNINFFDGRTWTYNSVDAYTKLFPFWTKKQLQRIINSLLDQGIIIKGNYNKSAYDRTSWYAFSDESIFLNGGIDFPKRENQTPRTEKPIPDVNTDSKPDINTDINVHTPGTGERDVHFTLFWKDYDKKINHRKCRKLRESINPDIYPVIHAHAAEYVSSTPDKKFRKNPETYIRNQCWNDEIIRPPIRQPAKSSFADNVKRLQELIYNTC